MCVVCDIVNDVFRKIRKKTVKEFCFWKTELIDKLAESDKSVNIRFYFIFKTKLLDSALH